MTEIIKMEMGKLFSINILLFPIIDVPIYVK
jgi:hypothetical protein